MNSRKNETITITINGQEIQINKAIKGAWYKMINDTRHNAQRAHTCRQPDYRRCCGDCQLCCWSCSGIFTPLKEAIDGYEGDSDAGRTRTACIDFAPNPEEVIESADTVEHLLKYARRICKDGDLILTMCAEKLSSYETAKRLGISQATLYYRLRKVQTALRAYYIKNFM